MDELGACLLGLARNAIGDELGFSPVATVDRPELDENAACFVTLTRAGRLRGCIGSLQAWRPLREDLCANARAAAFGDPRFAPLTAGEWPDTRVEVSLLSPPEMLPAASEAEAMARLQPGIDGIILHAAGRRATFLPQVWSELPEPALFLARLKEKAGLPATYWGPEVQLQRYAVRKWKESAP